MQDSIGTLERQVAELREDEKTLESKIKKKQAELVRNQKRLESLQSVRYVLPRFSLFHDCFRATFAFAPRVAACSLQSHEFGNGSGCLLVTARGFHYIHTRVQPCRPAFMDEYEKLERELAEEYEVYVTRFRNLAFLEHQLDEYNKVRSRHRPPSRSNRVASLQFRVTCTSGFSI